MLKNNMNLIVLIGILFLICIITYRYNTLSKENFEETPDTTNIPETTIAPPESSYSLKDYYESKPPTGSTVVKTEISHLLPDIINKDITLKDDTQIRFGTMRGEAGSSDDTFHISGVSDPSSPHLKMVLGDKQGKNSSLKIYGGACETDSNCALDGKPLYEMDSQPVFKINNKQEETIHHLNKDGDSWHKRNLTAGGYIEGKNMFLKKDGHVQHQFTDNGEAWHKSKLTVHDEIKLKNGEHDKFKVDNHGNITTNKINCINEINMKKGNQNVFNVDSNGNTINKGNLYVDGISNTNIQNIRGRLYFSQAGPNENPAPNNQNWDRVHHSDPCYVEKVHSGGKSTLKITINDDHNDAVEIWGGACDAGNCYGNGHKLFRVDGRGNLWLRGSIYTQGDVYTRDINAHRNANIMGYSHLGHLQSYGHINSNHGYWQKQNKTRPHTPNFTYNH